MGKSRISLNIHGHNVPDTAYLLDVLRKLNPVAVLVMDNLDLAKRIHTALPDTMTIYRHWGADSDDNDALQYTPEAWVKVRAAMAANTGLWMYTTNEPAFDAHTIQWHERVIELAAKQGLRVVVGNWGVGKPADVDNAWNMADRLLRLLDAHRDTAILSLHEYACGVITSGFIGGTPEERGLIMPDTWPVDTTNIGALWHCGRFRFLERYCNAHGFKPPRIIITEHGFDDVSDIKHWTETLVKTPVDGNPGGNIRGWKTLVSQWGAWFKSPEWTAEEAYYEQLQYADRKIYQGSSVEAQLIFSWGHSSQIWNQFDIAEARTLHELLIHHASVPTTPPPPEPPAPPEVIRIPEHPGLPVTGANHFQLAILVRGKPNGAAIGSIAPKAQYLHYPATDTAAMDDSGAAFVWRFVETGELRGWSRLDALGLDTPTPPVEPPPSDNGEAWAALAARIDALEVKYDRMIEAINAAFASFTKRMED